MKNVRVEPNSAGGRRFYVDARRRKRTTFDLPKDFDASKDAVIFEGPCVFPKTATIRLYRPASPAPPNAKADR